MELQIIQTDLLMTINSLAVNEANN